MPTIESWRAMWSRRWLVLIALFGVALAIAGMYVGLGGNVTVIIVTGVILMFLGTLGLWVIEH